MKKKKPYKKTLSFTLTLFKEILSVTERKKMNPQKTILTAEYFERF